MKTLNIKYAIIIILLFAGTAIYSQSVKSKIYYSDIYSISYKNEFKINKDSNSTLPKIKYILKTIDQVYKIVFINDSLISASSGNTSSGTDININSISKIGYRKSSVNIGSWIGLVAGAFTGGYYAGAETSPGVGRVFAAIGGALVGGFIGGSILGAFTPPSDYYETYNLEKYSRNKKAELQRILIENEK